MSNWRQYPTPELEAARGWLRDKEEELNSEGKTEDSRHCRVLMHHLQELIITHRNYFTLCEYRRSTEVRNVLAKQLFVALHQGKTLDYVRGDKAEHEMRKCLELADTFLDQSGEKLTRAQNVEEALREVLGWKP